MKKNMCTSCLDCCVIWHCMSVCMCVRDSLILLLCDVQPGISKFDSIFNCLSRQFLASPAIFPFFFVTRTNFCLYTFIVTLSLLMVPILYSQKILTYFGRKKLL